MWVMSPTRNIADSYANGYGSSTWGGEVLLREADSDRSLVSDAISAMGLLRVIGG